MPAQSGSLIVPTLPRSADAAASVPALHFRLPLARDAQPLPILDRCFLLLLHVFERPRDGNCNRFSHQCKAP
jgi:hypothetical protein